MISHVRSCLSYLGTFRQPIKPLSSLLSTSMSLATFNLRCQSYLACQSNFPRAAFGPRSPCCHSNVHQNQIYLVHRSLFLLRSLRASLPVFIRSSAFHVSFLLSFCPPVSNPLLLGQWFFYNSCCCYLFYLHSVCCSSPTFPISLQVYLHSRPSPLSRPCYNDKGCLPAAKALAHDLQRLSLRGRLRQRARNVWVCNKMNRMTGMTGQSGPNECWTAKTEWLWDTADGANRGKLLGWCTTYTSLRWAHWFAKYVYWQYENISRI